MNAAGLEEELMLTVGQFAAGFDACQLQCVAGFSGFSRELTAFSIVDSPEILAWLRGGEFVVDSGYVLKHNPYLLHAFIPSLKNKGCAAYGMKLHRYYEAVPEELIEQGNRYNFPVFALPYETRFCDFAYAIHKYLFEFQMEKDKKAMLLYQSMLDSLCRYKIPDRLLYELSIALDNPVLLTGRDFELVAIEGTGGCDAVLRDYFSLVPEEPVWGEEYIRSLLQAYEKQKFQLRRLSLVKGHDSLNCVLVVIMRAEGALNFLVIPEVKHPLESWQYQLLQNMVSLIDLSLQGVETQKSKQHAQDFVSSVLLSEPSPAEILRQCKLNGFDHESQRVCLNIRFDSYLQLSMSWRNIVSNILQQLVNQLVNSFQFSIYPLNHKNYRILYIFFKGKIYSKEAEKQAHAAAVKIYDLLKLNNVLCNIGISLCGSGLSDIAKAFRQSVDAIDLGAQLFPMEGIYMYSKLQIHHWLSSGMDRYELITLYETTVKPLRECQVYGVDYISVLESYIVNRYNVSKAAADMHVHRNTMNNYLEKIQTLLSLDMTIPENMLRVQMGIYAMRILDLEQGKTSTDSRKKTRDTDTPHPTGLRL